MSGIESITSKVFLPGIDGTASSDGTNGDAEKAWTNGTAPIVDPATTKGISEVDESPKYAADNAAWVDTDSYGNNGSAWDVAKNFMKQPSVGTNPFSNDDFQRALYIKRENAGINIFTLA